MYPTRYFKMINYKILRIVCNWFNLYLNLNIISLSTLIIVSFMICSCRISFCSFFMSSIYTTSTIFWTERLSDEYKSIIISISYEGIISGINIPSLQNIVFMLVNKQSPQYQKTLNIFNHLSVYIDTNKVMDNWTSFRY